MEFKFAQVITNIKKKKHLLRPHHRFQTPHVQGMELECPTNIKATIWSLRNSCYAKKTVGVDTHQNYLANTAQHGNGPFPL